MSTTTLSDLLGYAQDVLDLLKKWEEEDRQRDEN